MPPLLKVADAAAYLGLQVSTLHKWRNTGRGPRFIKMGGAIRYRLADLDAFICASTVASTAEVVAK
jgi:predicted DNA-binding transcriptional regulator AlpA